LVALFWHKEGRKPTRLVVSEIRFIMPGGQAKFWTRTVPAS